MLVVIIGIFLMILMFCCSFMTWDGDTEGCGCCSVRREDNSSSVGFDSRVPNTKIPGRALMTALTPVNSGAFHVTSYSSSLQLSGIEMDYLSAQDGVPSGFVTSVGSSLSLSPSPSTSSSAQVTCASRTMSTSRARFEVENQAAVFPTAAVPSTQPPQAGNIVPLPQQQQQQEGSVSESIVIGVIFAILAVCLIVASCCWVACLKGVIPFQLQSR
ncbi:hypothetical protein PG999_003462 [Apiospora kogelbergensis]|uniref:Uncharacterized protein n=1 Tax=Apiospora kogelbergensis TaxID=1337665 RepID=A0AAW0R3K3_9PEZI